MEKIKKLSEGKAEAKERQRKKVKARQKPRNVKPKKVKDYTKKALKHQLSEHISNSY